jgi:hypothetical protein
LVITFDWLILELSYFTCLFLLARPFIWYHDLDPLIFDLEVWNLWLGPFWLSLLVLFVIDLSLYYFSDKEWPWHCMINKGSVCIYEILLNKSTYTM